MAASVATQLVLKTSQTLYGFSNGTLISLNELNVLASENDEVEAVYQKPLQAGVHSAQNTARLAIYALRANMPIRNFLANQFKR
jgi:hypothetical protein